MQPAITELYAVALFLYLYIYIYIYIYWAYLWGVILIKSIIRQGCVHICPAPPRHIKPERQFNLCCVCSIPLPRSQDQAT